jgi:hypothetical protein
MNYRFFLTALATMCTILFTAPSATASTISVDYVYGVHQEHSTGGPISPSAPWYLNFAVTVPDAYVWGASTTTLLSSISGAAFSGSGNVYIPWSGNNQDLAANGGLGYLSVRTDTNGVPIDVWYDNGFLRYQGATASYSFVEVLSFPNVVILSGSATATQLNFGYLPPTPIDTTNSPSNPVGGPSGNSVPEPGTISLFGLAAIAAAYARRNRRGARGQQLS